MKRLAALLLLCSVAFADTDVVQTCYIQSAANTNATMCKSVSGNVYAVYGINTTSTNYFLHMFNVTSGPTCTATTEKEIIPVFGASSNGGGFIRTQPGAQQYSNGIGFCLTGAGSAGDNTNAATGVYITILYN